MGVALHHSQRDETDNRFKRKVFRVERLYVVLVIFVVVYPPLVVKYFLSDNLLASQQPPMMSSNCRGVECKEPADLLEVNNPV